MADGVAVIWSLLTANGALTGLVPVARIIPGVLPQGTPLPAIAITSVSSIDRNMPSPGSQRHVSERVQVTVMAQNYPSQKATLLAVKKAAADRMPTVAGMTDITVHTAGAGPDFMSEEAAIHQGSQDFNVRFNEAT